MKGLFLVVLSLIVTVAASGVAYYFYTRYQHTQLLLKNPQEAAKAEAKTLIADISKYMELPNNEQPTLATVTDAKKLADQPFFKRAQDGDKVLIYIQSREAILYRPSDKKIIAVAPISINNQQNQADQGSVAGAKTSATPAPTLKQSSPTLAPLPTFTPVPSKAP